MGFFFQHRISKFYFISKLFKKFPGSSGYKDSSPRYLQDNTAHICATVLDFHIVKENVMKPFAMYTIEVRIVNSIGDEELQKIYRRYSDFYALQEKVKEKYPKLSNIPFPSKKTFGNMEKNYLEKRRKMLDSYLKELLRPETLQEYPELIIFMTRFLDHTSSYESERSGVIKSATKSVRNSVKSAANAVTSVPSNIVHTMDSMVGGIGKVLTISGGGTGNKESNPQLAEGKVGASLETDGGADNIPLRILLLFMDEVFDLQERNQWLRRQIVAVLRQLIKAMFGNYLLI